MTAQLTASRLGLIAACAVLFTVLTDWVSASYPNLPLIAASGIGLAWTVVVSFVTHQFVRTWRHAD